MMSLNSDPGLVTAGRPVLRQYFESLLLLSAAAHSLFHRGARDLSSLVREDADAAAVAAAAATAFAATTTSITSPC